MLQTNLTHITSEDEFKNILTENENIMICCGRMGPMCIPVYEAMEELEPNYTHVKFSDMPFDHPVSKVIRTLPETKNFNGLPFTVYFKEGKVAKATSSIQTIDQISTILEQHFTK
ncbi:MAG: thioredoxin [Bacteroidota bacterium]|nr:thioredoxin [Bacteroidota bacterium]